MSDRRSRGRPSRQPSGQRTEGLLPQGSTAAPLDGGADSAEKSVASLRGARRAARSREWFLRNLGPDALSPRSDRRAALNPGLLVPMARRTSRPRPARRRAGCRRSRPNRRRCSSASKSSGALNFSPRPPSPRRRACRRAASCVRPPRRFRGAPRNTCLPRLDGPRGRPDDRGSVCAAGLDRLGCRLTRLAVTYSAVCCIGREFVAPHQLSCCSLPVTPPKSS